MSAYGGLSSTSYTSFKPSLKTFEGLFLRGLGGVNCKEEDFKIFIDLTYNKLNGLNQL
jgi:hypothetical protein